MRQTLGEIKSQNLFKREIDVDNFLLDTCFSSTDGLNFAESEDISFDDSRKIDEITYIINNMLPDIEKQVIYLLFFLKKNQEITGRILNISQEMVYYYKRRALLRIKIHYFLRKVDINAMSIFLEKYVTKKQHVAMIEYFKEHDLRKIAKKLSKIENRKKALHYEGIGSRIKLGIKKIKSLIKSKDPELKQKAKSYLEIFNILKSYNSLHHSQSKKIRSQEIIV